MDIFDKSAICNEQVPNYAHRIEKRKSINLFDLVIEVFHAKDAQPTEYEKSLTEEAGTWNKLLKDKSKDLQRAETSKFIINSTILTPAQKSYLEQVPDLRKFCEESEKFCQTASNFLREHAEIVEMMDELSENCNDNLDQVSEALIRKVIRGYE